MLARSRRGRSARFALLAVCCLPGSAAAGDGHVIHAFRSGSEPFGFDKWWGGNDGRSLAAAGDVDADGYGDVIVSMPLTPGFARVFSGADGRILHQFEGAADVPWFGRAVASAGDVDSDGHDDLVVGAGGSARVYSGRDGALIRTFSEPSSHLFAFGAAVAAMGDLDGDGFGDIVVGAAETYVGFPADEPVRVYSVRTGAMLLEFTPPTPDGNVGVSVAGGRDFDGDGVPDLVAGGDYDNTGGSRAGVVYVVSGATGEVLHAFLGVEPFDYLGASVDVLDDLDGDGVPEVLGGTLTCCTPGYTRVWSGASGRLIHHVDGEAFQVSALGDVDGDGLSEFTSGRDVHSGATAAVIASFGEEAYDRPIRAAGDVDGDGWPDILRQDYGLSTWPTTVNVERVTGPPAQGAISTTGAGCAPALGDPGPLLPTLQVTGTPEAGGAVALTLVGVPADTTALVLVGAVLGEQPLGNGCSLLLAPPFEVAALPTQGGQWGYVSVPARLPEDFAALVAGLHAQAVTLDASLASGISLSNRATVSAPRDGRRRP